MGIQQNIKTFKFSEFEGFLEIMHKESS